MATGRLPDPNTAPLTAKGDLYTYSTRGDRLAVGNNGETLVADSSATTGLRWNASQSGGKNAIINGGFDIWQRGTANVTTATAYTADRWIKGSATSFGISRQVTGDTTNLPFIQYSARSQRTASSSVTTINDFGYNLETADSLRFAGRTVTLSFYARAGANFSSTSNALSAQVYTGTGTDQNIMTSLVGTSIASTTATLTTTWQRFTATGTVGSTATQIALYFSYTPTGTAGANDWYEITGVQLEVGSTATQFSRAGGTLAGELAACQRYYYRIAATTAYTQFTNFAPAFSTTNATMMFPTKVTMRTTPTAIEYANVTLTDGTNFVAAGTLTIGTYASPETVLVTSATTGLTATTRSYSVWANNNNTAYLAMSAEL